jgi:hypothetical protein
MDRNKAEGLEAEALSALFASAAGRGFAKSGLTVSGGGAHRWSQSATSVRNGSRFPVYDYVGHRMSG